MDQLVVAGLTALGRDPAGATAIDRLAGGSGSGVFRVRFHDDVAVLKVSAGSNRADARRELRFYTELAALVPVRTPRLLGGTSSNDLVVMLLTAATPGPPAVRWDRDHWLEVARGLGSLHRTLGDHDLDPFPWLYLSEHEKVEVPDERVALWQVTPVAAVALPLLREAEGFAAAAQTLPYCLVHGDCHAENLLRADDGGLVWADWQMVRAGRGPEDLALLWQRAEFNEAVPPRAETLAEYAQARNVVLDDEFVRAVTAAELRLLLFWWPAFLIAAPSAGRDVLFEQLRRLGQQWRKMG